jgi:hypothetical protein
MLTPEEKADAVYVAVWTSLVVAMIVAVSVVSHLVG